MIKFCNPGKGRKKRKENEKEQILKIETIKEEVGEMRGKWHSEIQRNRVKE